MEDINKLQRDHAVLVNEKEMVVITARDIYCSHIKTREPIKIQDAVDQGAALVQTVNMKYDGRIKEAEEKVLAAMAEMQELKKKMMEGMQGPQQGKILRVPGCAGLEGCGH